MSSNKIELIQKLNELNVELNKYLRAGGGFFEIEKDQLLHTCRDIYGQLQSAPESQEKKAATVVAPQEDHTAHVNELQSELSHIKKELEEFKQIELERSKRSQGNSRWEESPKARYNELESNLNPEIVEQFVQTKQEEIIEPPKPIEPPPAAAPPVEVIPPVIEEHIQETPIEEVPIAAKPVPSFEDRADEILARHLEEQKQSESAIEKEIAPELKSQKSQGVSTSQAHTRFSLKVLVESQADGSLLSSLKQKPVTDLKKSIGLNEKFLYIRELFDNDHQEFASVIDNLNGLSGMDEAEKYLEREVLLARDWDLENEHVFNFMTIIYRRFI